MGFLEDTDLHGIKHVGRCKYSVPRRLLWGVVISTCFASFLALSAYRVRFYLSYPYYTVTNRTKARIPVPSVAICLDLSTCEGGECEAADWGTMNDAEFVYYTAVVLLADITIVNRWDNTLRLNDTFVGVIGEFTDPELAYLVMYHDTLSDYFANMPLFNLTILESFFARLKAVGRNFTVDYDIDKYTQNMSFSLEQVSCRFLSSNDNEIECSDHLEKHLVGELSCVILNNYDYTSGETLFYMKNNVDSFWERSRLLMPFKLRPEQRRHSVFALVMDPGELPSPSFMDVSSPTYIQSSYMVVEMTRSYYTQYLGVPYQQPCAGHNRHLCVQSCYTEINNCSLSFFHERYGKRLCGISAHRNAHGIYAGDYGMDIPGECHERCANPCSERGGLVSLVHLNSYVDDDDDHCDHVFHLTPGKGLAHEQNVDTPLYGIGALLNEVGGAMGLFVGASTITAYHFMEFCTLSLTTALRIAFYNKNLKENKSRVYYQIGLCSYCRSNYATNSLPT